MNALEQTVYDYLKQSKNPKIIDQIKEGIKENPIDDIKAVLRGMVEKKILFKSEPRSLGRVYYTINSDY